MRTADVRPIAPPPITTTRIATPDSRRSLFNIVKPYAGFGDSTVGLLSAILSGLAVRRPGSEHQSRVPPELERRVREAEAALGSVELPGYDIDIVSAGLVRRIRMSRDGRRIAVFVDYELSDPGCSFCRFISSVAWSKILREARRKLEAAGFDDVVFIDSASGSIIES
jgi:metal-sulfur cluster biosynthetic enzyme